ncbi:hypothetical protein F5888DRAFT_1141656 [Russula emetica]|nr:hypothetical protein F5888DRAFT_1141656 [Russula emetica]
MLLFLSFIISPSSASPTAVYGSFWFVDSGSLRWYYDSSTSQRGRAASECRGFVRIFRAGAVEGRRRSSEFLRLLIAQHYSCNSSHTSRHPQETARTVDDDPCLSFPPKRWSIRSKKRIPYSLISFDPWPFYAPYVTVYPPSVISTVSKCFLRPEIMSIEPY